MTFREGLSSPFGSPVSPPPLVDEQLTACNVPELQVIKLSCKKKIVGGFNPSEKYARQIRSFPQLGVKIKDLWNHDLEKHGKQRLQNQTSAAVFFTVPVCLVANLELFFGVVLKLVTYNFYYCILKNMYKSYNLFCPVIRRFTGVITYNSMYNFSRRPPYKNSICKPHPECFTQGPTFRQNSVHKSLSQPWFK